MLAVEPIAVMLPPKQDPKSMAQRRGPRSGWLATRSLTMGMKAATKTMLSMKAEPMAVIATMSGVRTKRFVPNVSVKRLASTSVTPVVSRAPATAKRTRKKMSVHHSTSASM